MRIPVKSERDAFRLTFGIVGVLVAAVLLGVLVTPWAGIGIAAGAVLGALAWEVGSPDPERPQPLREAAAAGRENRALDERRRILIVANETVAGQELREKIIAGHTDAELRVVCPILPSRAHLVTSDIDRELAEARERLDGTLSWANEQGLQMTGRVSDETPLGAVADELRSFPADEVIVSTHPPQRSRWLESGLVERLRAELDVPVVHVVVDVEREGIGA